MRKAVASRCAKRSPADARRRHEPPRLSNRQRQMNCRGWIQSTKIHQEADMALTQDDHTQIHALYARYAFASDFGPSEAWRDCFTPDALFEVNGKQHQGADALLKFAQGMHSRP